jgi:hypothetical protein
VFKLKIHKLLLAGTSHTRRKYLVWEIQYRRQRRKKYNDKGKYFISSLLSIFIQQIKRYFTSEEFALAFFFDL